jgi:hypothetical protein
MAFDRSKLKRTKAIALYRQFVLYEFREVGMFLLEMDSSLKSKISDIEDFAKTMIDSSDSEDTRIELIDNLLEERYQLDTTFKQMLFNSSFISAFAMFENGIQGMARHSLAEKFEIRKSNIIGNYKKDVEKAFNVKLDFGLWAEILNYREARNRLVHSSFQLTKQPESPMRQELRDFLSRVGFIKYKADDAFVISDRRFIEHFCNVAEQYLKQAFDKVIPLVKTAD